MVSELLIPLLELLSKLLIYLGGAAVIGGFFILWLSPGQPQLVRLIYRYSAMGLLLALLAITVNFYAQVGSFAEAGWAGMVDPVYVAMLWDSPIGQGVVLKVVALSLSVCLLLVAFSRSRQHLSLLSGFFLPVLMLLIFSLFASLWSISFSLTGHTTELNLMARFLLGLHVFIALLWLGSLLPLWFTCRAMAVHPLQVLMRRFGVIAIGLVPVLLMVGCVLAYQLLGSLSALISTPYGWLLLVNMLLVNVMLLFAGWHKWRLVPQLTDRAAANRLSRSILLESVVGLSILMVTVVVSTAVGPAMAE